MKLTFMSHIPSWRRGMNLEIIIQILSIYMWTIIIYHIKYKNIFDNHVLAVRTHLSLSSSTLASWPRRMNDDNKMKDDRVWKKPVIIEGKELEFVGKALQYMVRGSVCNQNDDDMMSTDFNFLSYHLLEIFIHIHCNCFSIFHDTTLGHF